MTRSVLGPAFVSQTPFRNLRAPTVSDSLEGPIMSVAVPEDFVPTHPSMDLTSPSNPPVKPGDFAGDPSPSELDPELLSLPDPPRKERRLTVLILAFTAVASLVMVVAL